MAIRRGRARRGTPGGGLYRGGDRCRWRRTAILLPILAAWTAPSTGCGGTSCTTPPVAAEPVVEQATSPTSSTTPRWSSRSSRMRKRLAIWEIFMAYMRDGATSWSQAAAGAVPRGLRQDHGHLRRRPVARPPAGPAVGSVRKARPRPIQPTLGRAAAAALGDGQAFGMTGSRRCVAERRRPLLAKATHLRVDRFVGSQESAKSTTTGAWSDGFCPLRASRSRNAPVARCTKSSLTRTRSMRSPRPWWKSPAR